MVHTKAFSRAALPFSADPLHEFHTLRCVFE